MFQNKPTKFLTAFVVNNYKLDSRTVAVKVACSDAILVTSQVIFGSSRVIWSKFLVESSQVTRVTVQSSVGRVTENQSSHSLLKSTHESSLVTSLVTTLFWHGKLKYSKGKCLIEHSTQKFRFTRINNEVRRISVPTVYCLEGLDNDVKQMERGLV